jgi:glycosyltransferase involved in cell wall biosynthesis
MGQSAASGFAGLNVMRTVLFTMRTAEVVGGVESRQARLAPLLPAHGWRAVFGLAWGARFHDPAAFTEAYPNLETILLDGRSGTSDGRQLAIRRAIAKTDASVVVPGMMIDTFEAVAGLKSRGSDVRLLGGLYGINTQVLLPLRYYGPVLDQTFAVSRLTAHVLHDVCEIPEARIHYVPSGIPRARELAVSNPAAPLRIGLIGRLDNVKRPLDLIGLLVELDARNVAYTVTVVGDGVLAEPMTRGLEPWRNRVTVVPAMTTDQLYERVYPRLDVCLLFSPSEGVPNVLMEAMVHGVVPVTSDFRGRSLQGLLRHDETALVFPTGDVRAAADSIAWLDRNRGAMESLAQQARSAAETEHSLEGMGDAFARVLEKTIAGAALRAAVPPLTPLPGRLTGLIGSTAAERLRVMLGRRFLHTDPSEWPLHYSWPEALVENVEKATTEAIPRREKEPLSRGVA